MLLSIIRSVAAGLLMNLFFVMFSKFPVFVGSLAVIYFRDFTYLSMIIRIIAHILHLLVTFHIFMALVFIQLFILLFVGSAVPFWQKELNVKRLRHRTVAELRTPIYLSNLYREVQLVNKVFISVLGYVLVPTQTLITQLVLFVCYRMSKHRNKLGATVEMVMVSWVSVLELGGYLILNGENVLKSWKYQNWELGYNKKLMSKFRKSCKPIMINFKKT